jgi:hypothetical protein
MRACIIPCGAEDLDGDILYEDDILDIYNKFNNRNNITLRHNGVYLNDVELLESYITNEEEKVALEVVPRGSWVVLVKSDNEEMNKAIMNGEVNGVSITNVIKDTCPLKPNTKYENPNDYDYNDVDVKKCVYPQDLSFVKSPANAYGIHIADDLNKITKEVKKMSLLEDLKKLLSNYDEPETEAEEAEVEVVEETVEEVEAIEAEAEEEAPAEEEPATIEKEDKAEESEEAEPEAETETPETDSDIQAQLDDIYRRLEELESKTNVEAPKIVKETKKIVEPVSEPVIVKNYYDLSGRDPVTGMRK